MRKAFLRLVTASSIFRCARVLTIHGLGAQMPEVGHVSRDDDSSDALP
jgi:hypothetical protein